MSLFGKANSTIPHLRFPSTQNTLFLLLISFKNLLTVLQHRFNNSYQHPIC